jgi:uncharacterized protein
MRAFSAPDILTGPGRLAKLARLMPGLPQYVDPLRLAESRESITGRLEVSEMPRLREALRDDSGVVEFQLRFSRDERGVVRITGDFSSFLNTVCQRCLEPMELRVSGAINVSPVTPELSNQELPAGAEPLALNAGRIHLPGFIEDEVLLALPIAPMHEGGACAGRRSGRHEAPQRARPFDALKQLNLRKD